MKKNKKVMLGFSLISVVILILLIAATPGSSGVEITIQDVLEDPKKYEDRFVVTQGFLIEETIQWEADLIELRFDIQDQEGHYLSVFHHGVRPDNFSEGVIVILEGFVEDDGTFNAERVKTQCPSKYEAEDSSLYDEDFHEDLNIEKEAN